MAALYLHNAIHIQEPSNSSWTSPSPHNRNTSMISNATLLTTTSEHSHPTEPLLHSHTSESVAYLDLLSRQPTHPSAPHLGWTTSLSLNGDPITSRERKGFREHFVKRRLRRLNVIKSILEFVMGAFAVYNTVRYFIAYTIYDSIEGQNVSLAMGISTGASFAFLMCAVILAVFQPYLLVHQIPLRPLLLSRTAFHSLASFSLFGPAVVNVVMLFVWRNSSVPELVVQRRCHVDIDIIWSASSAECKPSTWGVWLTLSSIRLILTACIIISYHFISSSYHRLRRPSLSRTRRRRHTRDNPSESYQSSLSPSMTGLSSPLFVAPQANVLRSQERSDSTLRSHTNSKYSSTNHHQSPTAASSVYSDDEFSDHDHNPELYIPRLNSANNLNGETEVELNGFRDRFRSLVSQITRETEEGLELARPDSALSPPQETFSLPEDYRQSNIPPTIGYDEFGRPYPPDESVLILNGYVRRMPTIESMGSREVGSITTSSIHTDRDTMSMSIRSTPISRPPTRTGTISQPPSRSNSITAGAEILLGAGRTNEIGELIDRTDRGDSHSGRRGSLTSSGHTGTGSSYPSTMSYYTATSHGSLGPSSDRGHSPSPTFGYTASQTFQKFEN